MQTSEGLPALLVYKSGQIIGNFVKLEDTFGQDFFAIDVESFLIEWVLIMIIWDFYFFSLGAPVFHPKAMLNYSSFLCQLLSEY